jgi:Dolichyl-phosphate-mannose-protein mannosyltransferase
MDATCLPRPAGHVAALRTAVPSRCEETGLIDKEQRTSPTGKTALGATHEFWFAVIALTILYLLFVSIGNRRYVWFDELFTFDIANSPSLKDLWHRELAFDLQPPAGYLLSRASMHIFGANPFGLRFPSMVEFYVGSLAVLLYVQRKAGVGFATLAVLLLWGASPTLYYAVEARPYALIFFSFSCLLLSWDIATRSNPRRLALLGVGMATFCLATAHVFSVFTLFAFIVAEGVRFWRRRKADYALWAALFLPMLAMSIYVPLTRAFAGVVFAIYASPQTISSFYLNTLGAPILSFVLLAVLLAASMPGDVDPKRAPEFAAEDLALFACLLANPILVNLLLIHRRGTFYDRYCLTSQVAIMAALAIFLGLRVRRNRWAAYVGSIVLVFFIVKTQVWHVLHFPAPRNAAFLASIQPSLPIVVGEGQVFVEMNRYESASLLSRVYFLKDSQASMQYMHTNLFQDYMAPDVMKKAGFPFTANVAQYSRFVSQHRQFLLLGARTEWVFQKLLYSGASIAFVGGYSDLLYLDKDLYLITMPSQ